MKKSFLVTEIIFCCLIIIVGLVWVYNCVSGLGVFREHQAGAPLWDYLLAEQITIDFYASLVLIFVGTYRLCHTCLSIEVNRSSSSDAFASISKYKELLDKELITQEEFESKKRELLNL